MSEQKKPKDFMERLYSGKGILPLYFAAGAEDFDPNATKTWRVSKIFTDIVTCLGLGHAPFIRMLYIASLAIGTPCNFSEAHYKTLYCDASEISLFLDKPMIREDYLENFAAAQDEFKQQAERQFVSPEHKRYSHHTVFANHPSIGDAPRWMAYFLAKFRDAIYLFPIDAGWYEILYVQLSKLERLGFRFFPVATPAYISRLLAAFKSNHDNPEEIAAEEQKLNEFAKLLREKYEDERHKLIASDVDSVEFIALGAKRCPLEAKFINQAFFLSKKTLPKIQKLRFADHADGKDWLIHFFAMKPLLPFFGTVAPSPKDDPDKEKLGVNLFDPYEAYRLCSLKLALYGHRDGFDNDAEAIDFTKRTLFHFTKALSDVVANSYQEVIGDYDKLMSRH